MPPILKILTKVDAYLRDKVPKLMWWIIWAVETLLNKFIDSVLYVIKKVQLLMEVVKNVIEFLIQWLIIRPLKFLNKIGFYEFILYALCFWLSCRTEDEE